MREILKLGITILFVIALAIPAYAAISASTQPITPESVATSTAQATQVSSSEVEAITAPIHAEPYHLQGNCTDLTGYDEYIVNESTTLCNKIYHMKDSNFDGAIILNSDNIELDCNGATITGDTSFYGIFVDSRNNVSIKNCILTGYLVGEYVINTSSSTMENNTIYDSGQGFSLRSSEENNITYNSIYNVTSVGIDIVSSPNNIISYNTLYNASTGIGVLNSTIYVKNTSVWFNGSTTMIKNVARNNFYGILIQRGTGASIVENNLTDNSYGVFINNDRYFHIDNNIIRRNKLGGIHIEADANGPAGTYGIVQHNLFIENNNGIDFSITYPSMIFASDFLNNTFCNNEISVNNMEFYSWSHEYKYNNFINSSISPQVVDQGVNFYTYNHWSDYNGSDSNNDNIGDMPYFINNITDNVTNTTFTVQDIYPLMQPNLNAPPCEIQQGEVTPPRFYSVVLTGTYATDVNISWYASSDDNLPMGTRYYLVERYNEFPWGGKFIPATLVKNVTADGSSIYSVIDSGRGDGDLNNYFYSVRAFYNSTYYIYSWENDSVWGGSKFVKQMNAGKDFISFPSIQWNNSLTEILKILNFDYVRYYNSTDSTDNWKSYLKNKTFNDLNYLDHKMSFWINLLTNDNFTVAGLVPKYTEIPLYKGWNMVGYPSFINRTVSEALKDIPWTAIEGFDPNSPSYNLKRLTGNDIMSAGNGYWIEVSNDAVWNVTNIESRSKCPKDDTYINKDTIFEPEYCYVNDTNNDGILIINASDITLDCNGMTLESIVNPPPPDDGRGIVSNKPNVTIKNCILKKFYSAISIEAGANDNKIYNNTLDDNNGGVFITGAPGNYVNGTLVENNKGDYNMAAVYLLDTFFTLINNNTFNVGYYGFDLRQNAYNTTITNNILNSSAYYYAQYASGILLYAQSNTTVVKNTFNRNNKGIYFYAGWPSIVLNNSFCNSLEGMHIDTSNNIIYHNNIVNNTIQVLDFGFSSSIFDNGKEGNYWSDYNGTDSNGDGIGDSPYTIDLDSKDNFPLMNPNSNAPLC
jgi:parallel beta-helix repeat protein